MTVYKVTVRALFYVDSDGIHEAKDIADKAVASLPNAEVNIKATKMIPVDFGNREVIL